MTPVKHLHFSVATSLRLALVVATPCAIACDPSSDLERDAALREDDDDDAQDELAADVDEPEEDDGELDPEPPARAPSSDDGVEDPVADVDLAMRPDSQGFAFRPEILGDGSPPVSCNSHQVITGVTCTGDCTNLQVECHDYAGMPFSARQWKAFISEEAPNNSRDCPVGQYVTGMHCDGGWCDNVSIECTATPYATNGCFLSDPISNGTFLAPVGTAIAGATCSGGYCSSMRFRVCSTT